MSVDFIGLIPLCFLILLNNEYRDSLSLGYQFWLTLPNLLGQERFELGQLLHHWVMVPHQPPSSTTVLFWTE